MTAPPIAVPPTRPAPARRPDSDVAGPEPTDRPWWVTGGTPLGSLTGLRWLAAALVFVFHVSVVGYFGGTGGAVLAGVFGAGSTGVSLFFVLSGFVLAWSHVDDRPMGTFYVRRIARVWPAHAVWVVVAIAAAASTGMIRPDGGVVLRSIANVGLVSAWVPAWWQAGNPVSWSLVCEAFFYAVFPLLWWAIRRVRTARGHLVLAVALCGAAWLMPVVLQWTHLVGSANAASHHPLGRWPKFAVGATAAVAMRSGLWRGPRLLPAVVVSGTSYLVTSLAGGHLSAVGVMITGHVLLVSALARCDRTGGRTGLRGPRARHHGTVSYTFYLAHLTILGGIASAWPGGHPRLALLPALALTAVALVAALLAAELTHRFIESPGQRWVLAHLTPPGRAARRRSAGQDRHSAHRRHQGSTA